MKNRAKSLAMSILGPRVTEDWIQERNGLRYSRWTQTDIISGFSIVIAVSAKGEYHVTESIETFTQFISDTSPDLSDVESAIDLVRNTLPGTRRVLFEDDDGLIRHLYGPEWESPEYKDGAFVFYCNHAERGIIERWIIDGRNVSVADVATGSSSLDM